MIRVCLDPKVLVAAFAARGLCSDLLAHVQSEQHMVVPDAVREEALRLLSVRIKLSSEALDSVVAVLDRCERAPASSEPSPVPVRDPDDAKILADAVAARVQILVAGDRDLLDIAEESPIPILSPRAFFMLTRGSALQQGHGPDRVRLVGPSRSRGQVLEDVLDRVDLGVPGDRRRVLLTLPVVRGFLGRQQRPTGTT